MTRLLVRTVASGLFLRIALVRELEPGLLRMRLELRERAPLRLARRLERIVRRRAGRPVLFEIRSARLEQLPRGADVLDRELFAIERAVLGLQLRFVHVDQLLISVEKHPAT